MKKVNLVLWITCFTFLLLFNACKPKDEIPAFIYIESIGIPGHTSNIPDVWVVVGDTDLGISPEILGAFKLPALIPVLGFDGIRTTAIIRAGIKNNGITSLPSVYPMYTIYEEKISFAAGKTDTIYPQITYLPEVEIDTEGFNIGEHQFTVDLDEFPATKIVTDASCRPGDFVGKATLDSSNNSLIAANFIPYEGLFETSLDVTTAAYIEMDYKTDVTISIGLIGLKNGEEQQIVFPFGVNPSEEWKKIYFNIGAEILALPYPEHRIAIAASLPDGVESATICVDNIKVVQF